MGDTVFHWTTRDATPEGAIDVSSYGSSPYNTYSPFTLHSTPAIPIPGRERERACSVEGIWQGLKQVHGGINEHFFTRKPKKIRARIEGHQFGKHLLGIVDARLHIYVPAYVFHVINTALPPTAETLKQLVETGGSITLYDVEDNNDIRNPDTAYSHASLLADTLNTLWNSPLPPWNKRPFDDLESQLDATLNYRETLNPWNRKIIDDSLTFAYLYSGDPLRETFALRFIKTGINDLGRLEHYSPSQTTQPIFAELFKR